MENKQARKAHKVADSQVIYTSKGVFSLNYENVND